MNDQDPHIVGCLGVFAFVVTQQKRPGPRASIDLEVSSKIVQQAGEVPCGHLPSHYCRIHQALGKGNVFDKAFEWCLEPTGYLIESDQEAAQKRWLLERNRGYCEYLDAEVKPFENSPVVERLGDTPLFVPNYESISLLPKSRQQLEDERAAIARRIGLVPKKNNK